MTTASVSVPFLERQRELAELQAQLDAMRQGQARLVAVCAEAGLGKSRLVEEFARGLPADVRFLSGRAFSATATTPYAVWVDAIEPHLRSLPRRELLHALGDSPELRRLFPAVAAQFPLHADTAGAEELGPEQTRLFGQFCLLLARLSEAAPVVLALDNLQWADRSSIELLHAALRGLAQHRVLVIALYRAEEVGREAPLSSCIVSLERLGLVTSIMLDPLGADAVAALVAHGTGCGWPGQAIRQLHLRTQGNPFFILELVKQSVAKNSGHPFRANHDDGALPASIGDLLSERIRRLEDDARRVLAIAAVIEAGISYGLLRAITKFGEERLLAALDELCALRLLDEVVQDSEVSYQFHQPLVQTTVYERMSAARRQYLHRVVACELMKCGGKEPDHATRVARHLVAGTAEQRQGEALPYLLEAADHAVALFGNHEAIALLRSALRIMEPSHGTPEMRFKLEANLGESYKRLGQFDKAVEIWSAALPHADDRQRAGLRRCIGRALWQAGRDGDARTHLEEGVKHIGFAAGSIEAGFLRQELAQARARQGDITGALEDACHVLEAVDEEQCPELAARAHIVLCLAHGYRGDMRSAFQSGARAIALSETLAYPGAAYLAHYTLAALLRYDGDPNMFEMHTAQCSRIAERMHAVALESWPLSVSIERYTLLGRLREAVDIGERAVALDREIGQGTILPRSLAFLAVAYRLSGELARARQCIDEAGRIVDALGKTELRSVVVVQGAAAYIDFLEGRHEEALVRLDALLASLVRPEPLRFYLLHPHVLPLAAEAAARAGQTERARDYVAQLKAMQRGSFRPAEGTALQVAGLIELALGNHEGARAELTQAVKVWERMQRPFDAARTRIDLALAHEAAGNREAAVSELDCAGNALRELGAARELAMTSQRLRKWGIRPAFDLPRRAAGHTVSARETDVIGLIAKGKTNREIAAELFLSELTIETHVKNILRKLGLKSRAQVAAHAVQLQEKGATIMRHPAQYKSQA
jgi:DNA-binding CsgD family transcriptional regulator